MPISIRYKNDPSQECVIRPTPLVSITDSVQRTKEGIFGKTYSITLTGYILTDQGFPLARDSVTDDLFDYWDAAGTGNIPATGNAGPYLSFDTTQSHYFQAGVADNRPKQQHVPFESSLDAILFKQKVLRSLFSRDGQRMEITPVHMDEPSIICYPRFVDISFSEGVYINLCQYTIQLETDTLLNKDLEVDSDGNPLFLEDQREDEILAASGRFIDSYSDSWSLEVDDSFAESENLQKSYRITRNISAVGKDHYGSGDLLPDGRLSPTKKKAWEQARDYVQLRMNYDSLHGMEWGSGITVPSGYPNALGFLGSGIYNLISAYQGFNKTRTESIGVDDGSYSVTENWLLASGKAYETYNMSVSTSIDSPFVSVSINGEVKGLTSFPPSGDIYGGNFPTSTSGTPYKNALDKYYEISSSGRFGVGSNIFKRANNTVAVELNAQPKSVSLGLNERAGEISYALEFDNRPTNILSGVLTESISITDTYPGDVFATIPILGRKTGPILQALGSRTEYRRDFTLDLLMDYTDLPYGSGRSSLLLQKPSLVEPIRTQLIRLVRELSPEKEPGIRKWFVSAPVENWTPKEGRYNLSLSWTYELDR
jgi:hypothetical protein